ncbi:MAG: radical SAM protein [Eggerthellaceae bacterium]|nr:radical SAM protein [Eggerthellaceae bacterium]
MRKYDREFILNHYKNHYSFHMDISEHLKGDEELVVGSIDVCVTTRCNLACKGCGSLMPLYGHPEDVDLETLLLSLDRFFSVVDRVFRVNVVGGEPFICPHMDRVIEFLNSRDEVIWTVVPSNGLVVPKNPRLFKALGNPKNHVRISHYEHFDDRSKLLITKLREEGIDYSVKEFGDDTFLWYDFGDYENRGRNSAELANQYRSCEVEWMSLYQGKLYPCPRAAHSIDLGLQPAEGNYVDVLDETISLERLKFQLEEFVYEASYYPACNRCDRGTGLCPVIPVAEQG